MRNEKRIAPLLDDFGNVWEQCFPDWRFMQVISNFQSWLGNDGFYIEDSDLIERFCKFAADMVKNGKREG